MSVETKEVTFVKSLNQHCYIWWIIRLWNKISSRRLFWSRIPWSQTQRNSRRNLQNWGSFQTIWKWFLSCEWNKSKDVFRLNLCATRSQWSRQDNHFEHDYWSTWCIDRKCWSFWSWSFQKYEISETIYGSLPLIWCPIWATDYRRTHFIFLWTEGSESRPKCKKSWNWKTNGRRGCDW